MGFTEISWQLSDIINKTRNVSGTPLSPTGQSALTDQQIVNYINAYYAFTMPFELKNMINFQPIYLNTFEYQDVYTFPGNGTFLTDQPMAYANGFPLVFYTDRDLFFQDWPQQYTSDNVATGNGSAGPYTGTTLAFPIISGTYQITDGTQILSDSGVLNNPSVPYIYNLTGNGSGTINVVTGAFSATFTNAVSTSLTIYDNYQAYQPARPQGILYYNNTFTFRPIPDQVYEITLQGYSTQSQLTSDASTPLQTEWGQLLAYGAAVEIFADRGDMVASNNTYAFLKRYENVALNRYVQQLDSSQSVPRF